MAFDEEQAIRRIRAQLLTAATLPIEANRFWDNVQYQTPAMTAGVSWLRETMQMIAEDHTATDQVTSRFRVVYDVFVAAGSGNSILDATTKAIMEVFAPSQWLRGPPNDCPIVIETAQRGLGFKDSETQAWFFRPVELICRSHVPNPSLIP